MITCSVPLVCMAVYRGHHLVRPSFKKFTMQDSGEGGEWGIGKGKQGEQSMFTFRLSPDGHRCPRKGAS